MRTDCIYPDWEGGYTAGKHLMDNDGYCRVCGMRQAEISPTPSTAGTRDTGPVGEGGVQGGVQD